MISQRILAFLHGYVVAMVQGKGSEALINQAIAGGITFWDVQRKAPDIIIFKLQAEAYPRLRPYFWRTRTRGKILRRRGWPFIWQRIKRKKGWLLGMVVFLFTLYYLSSYIWVVEITGVKTIDQARIRQNLTELGLRPGVGRKEIEAKRDWLIKELRMRLPEAVWVTVHLQGVVSLVTVTEKTPPPAVDQAATDLVAAKDGLITSLIVVDGTAVVEEGDTVSRGDLLIMGEKTLRYLDGRIETKRVKAVGKVMARVWYELVIEEPLVVYEPVSAPGRRVVYSLRIKNRLLPLFAQGKVEGRFSQQRYGKTILRGRNRISFVELIKDVYQTTNWVKREISPENALLKARLKGEEQMAYLLSPGVKPFSRSEEWELSEEVLNYRLVVEVVEDIAIPKLKEENN
ncbi:MAG: sporulation protein YqfD [Firmicutes bacterium]|nr:sporulation protein YqfD [Bacillota bacterium]